MATIPVVLFAYARPEHLARVLAKLRENRVPLILAYSDGPKDAADAAKVAAVRAQLRAIDWAEVQLTERPENLGLGRNVLTGLTAVAERYPMFIVWEDDLICVPGTYDWVCAALRHYVNDTRVMSVTAWTHPRVTPGDVGDAPYLDARAECWVWGTYARAWRGMEQSASEKIAAIRAAGQSPSAYGADLSEMARVERRKNIWAVRWLFHHLQHGGLCVRPPWSMVEHIGFDAAATNAGEATEWANPPLRACPPVPAVWPEAREHPAVRALWAAANPAQGEWQRLRQRITRRLRRELARVDWKSPAKALTPPATRAWLRRTFGWRWFRGDYGSWAEARAQARGYDDAAGLARVIAATRAVRLGQASWERDGVLFTEPEVHAPLLAALQAAARDNAGRLTVVDFGGALGSTWWQHRAALAEFAVEWKVVEQPALVTAGRSEFAGDGLEFCASLAEVGAGDRHLALLSSVLPYVEAPHALLEEVVALGFAHVIVDRMPFITAGQDRLVVQHTPPRLGGGSYPAWLFARDGVARHFAAAYELVAEWPVKFDQLDARVTYGGWHFRRRV